jgi:hypothetical protein
MDKLTKSLATKLKTKIRKYRRDLEVFKEMAKSCKDHEVPSKHLDEVVIAAKSRLLAYMDCLKMVHTPSYYEMKIEELQENENVERV